MKDTLKTLLEDAKNYAEFSMRNIGHVPPTMLAVTPEGTLTFLPDGLEDEKAKTSFANTARMICIGYGANRRRDDFGVVGDFCKERQTARRHSAF